jgi:chemotaxis protein CheD
MNHFLLPGDVDDPDMSTRYGVNAMEVLINEMMKLGANRGSFRAKVFGGADIFQADHPLLMIGKKNTSFVQQFLRTEGIPIVGGRTGGTEGVIIHYFTDAFEIHLKTITNDRLKHTEREEETYRTKLTFNMQRPAEDSVTLF